MSNRDVNLESMTTRTINKTAMAFVFQLLFEMFIV